MRHKEKPTGETDDKSRRDVKSVSANLLHLRGVRETINMTGRKNDSYSPCLKCIASIRYYKEKITQFKATERPTPKLSQSYLLHLHL